MNIQLQKISLKERANYSSPLFKFSNIYVNIVSNKVIVNIRKYIIYNISINIMYNQLNNKKILVRKLIIDLRSNIINNILYAKILNSIKFFNKQIYSNQFYRQFSIYKQKEKMYYIIYCRSNIFMKPITSYIIEIILLIEDKNKLLYIFTLNPKYL